MIRVLENNTIGQVLAASSGVLLLIVLGLMVLWALPPSAGSSADDAAQNGSQVSVATLQSAAALESYAVITDRPVFNEDRRPDPVLDEGEGLDEELLAEDMGAPDVELAGIVITPSLRMATLRSKELERSLVAFEGKPLEGDFGTWQISRIDERQVTLASADGEELQLKLQVHDAVIEAPPESARQVAAAAAEAGKDATASEAVQAAEASLTRAEEIRQRIEERREELRRAAEQRQQEGGTQYQQAIQSMIQKGRRADEDQEQERE